MFDTIDVNELYCIVKYVQWADQLYNQCTRMLMLCISEVQKLDLEELELEMLYFWGAFEPHFLSFRRVVWLRPVPKHIGNSIYNMLKIVLASLVRAPRAAA